MNQKQRLIGWLAAVSLTALMLVFTGCGGSSDTMPVPPAKPTGIVVTPGNSQASVTWSAVSDATSYNIYYGTAAGVTTTTGAKIVNAASPQVVTNLTNGTAYYFVVTAVNGAGESVVSNEVSTAPVPPAPAKPSGIVVSGGDGQVTVSWGAVTGATSYNIYYGTAAGVTTGAGIKVANVTTPQIVTGLTNGTPYFFVVTAVNAGGESGVSSEKNATPAAAPQPPGSPTGRTVTSTVAGQATVSWSAVTGATSYNVYYLQASSQPTNAAVLATAPVNSATASLNLTGLTSGATYYVLVTAVNAAGESGTQTKAQSVTIL